MKAWLTPTGRLHSFKDCSGIGQHNRSVTKRVTLSQEDYQHALLRQRVCACLRWTNTQKERTP